MNQEAVEHPFAPFVRILARGKSKSRPMTRDEAREAMAMVLREEVLPEQLGAFLMLLRFKEETAEEVAGFVDAARADLASRGLPALAVDLDWPTYAGKKRQLPWFLLATLLLAQHGVRTVVHGASEHTPGRIYTAAAMAALGLPVAGGLDDVAGLLDRHGLSYLPLEVFCPRAAALFTLKPVLGLRSPVHTVARMINPFGAPGSIQGIFHPGFLDTHHRAAHLLGQPHAVVFRGEGGEGERRPGKPAELHLVHNGVATREMWAQTLAEPRQAPDEDMTLDRLPALWRGAATDDYGEAAVIGTTAIALVAAARAAHEDAAHAIARRLWQERNKEGWPVG